MNLTKPQKLIYDMEKYAGGSINVICGVMLTGGVKEIAAMQAAVHEIFRLNDALRTRIVEDRGEASQYFAEYAPQEVEVLRFESKAAFDDYANSYAKIPFDFHGQLCEIKVVVLPDKSGILVKFHHIVGDAWTIALIGTQFNALLNGEMPEPYSYVDYIASEEAYLESSRYAKDRAFFLEQFQKCEEVTYLSEKESRSFEARRKTFVLDSTQAGWVSAYAKENGISPFVLFLAAVAAYINRVKQNAEKFYMGTAVLNRSGPREKNTMGMFVNTAPMLMELDNEKSFLENLSPIKAAAMAALRHQKFNYGETLAAIRQEYGFTETLYDVMLSYQNANIIGAEGIDTTWYHCGMQNETLQIHIDDRDNEGIFCIHFDYQTEKFTEQEIEKMYGHVLNLLFDAIKDDSKRLYELKLLSEEEKRQILHDFNATAADYPKDKCVHQLFEEQVEKTPDKTAVIACDATLTYRELNEQANRIACSLIAQGVKHGDIVAFALPRRSTLIAAMFGILKPGAAYLPIDPEYPQERINYMLEDSNAAFFITEENIESLLACVNASNPHVAMSSSDLCYCIYTSGSTGQPKGTLLRHQGIINLVTNLGIYHDLSQCERIGFMTTITFDVATQEIFTALLNGFTGVLMPERRETTSEEIIEGIVKNKIDVIYATPTYFDALTDTDVKAKTVLDSVKVVVLAGEKFGLNSYVLNQKDSSNVIFENQYGPVELHVIAVATTLKDDDFDSIGKPVFNDKAYIVDRYLQPVPIGVTGELCIAGDGVGAGYLNRPELTAEKFIDNPFGEGRLYKTGDLAYWREDGNIVYVGRNDFQVKIRGLRIELGEIESAISSIEGISQAVVVVRKNDEGRQLICAFYTGSKLDARDIRTLIGQRLPKYMLPHICTHLEEMPLTSSGKVNRKALPEVDLYAIDTAVEYVSPRTEQERILVSAIEAVLKIEKVSIEDNFFDLGGDSLKSIELLAKLEKLGYHTDTKTIFACDTVRELAAELVPISETEEEPFEFVGDIPATPAQMRVYTAQAMQGGTVYNVPYVFRVESLDPERLQQAMNAMLDRHEILRTYFENKDGNIIQVAEDSARCVVEQLATDDISCFVRPFDLSKAPLLRVGYYENTVMIDMHHIITDGGSMPVFLRELNGLYMGRTLNNKSVQYKQFAVTPQDHSESEKYWLSVYGDELPDLTINTDFKRGQKQSFHGSAVYDTVDIELDNQIQNFCKKQNITPYVFYMAAYNILLSKFSGCEDIVVGMPISGRESKFLDTIGMFVNTIALRNKPAGTKSVTDFLQEIKETSIAAIDHQDYPFGDLVKKLGLNTSDRNPLFDVMFAYQSEEMTEVTFGDKPAELLSVPVTTSKYDFTFNVLPRDKDVVLMVEYCTDLYREQTIQRMLISYKLLLQQMLESK